MKNNVEIYDAIIIGGGPSGVSAALYIVRGNKSVCLIDGGGSALLKAHRVDNYYGVGTVSGEGLYKSGLKQASRVGATVINGQATACSYDGISFSVTVGGEEIKSRTLVIATGASRSTADIDGLKDFEGRGVSYCAVCDAFFYRNKRVGVIGAGGYAEHELNALKGVVGEACLFTDGETPSFSTDTKVYTQTISRISGDERVSGVELGDGTKVDIDGVFVALGVLGAVGIAKSVGVLTNDSGEIIVDGRGMTNIDGLYAIGDCTAGIKQVARAVNDGLTVGTDILKRLKNR